MGLFKSITGTLLGKKSTPGLTQLGQDPDIQTTQRRAREAQREVLGSLDNTDKFVGAQIGAKQAGLAEAQRQARGGFGDQRRIISSTLARRGLGGTSIGLSAALGAQQRLSDRLGSIEAQKRQVAASAPLLTRQAQLQRGQFASSILQAPGVQRSYMRTPTARRSGGLLPLLGTIGGGVAGGMAGGPQGAAAGAQLGGGLAGALQQSF